MFGGRNDDDGSLGVMECYDIGMKTVCAYMCVCLCMCVVCVSLVLSAVAYICSP